MRLDRREFLKRIGLGSLALAPLLKLIDGLAKPAWGQAPPRARAFQFVAFSRAGTVDGVVHTVGSNGEGKFDPESGWIEGGGGFLHFDDASVMPKRIINSGRWKARKILKYEKQVGTYGRIAASILEMEVDLLPDLGPVRRIEGANLRIICNIGAAGLMTGEPEGYVLTVPGAPFGPFRPLSPVLGLTHISVPGASGERA